MKPNYKMKLILLFFLSFASSVNCNNQTPIIIRTSNRNISTNRNIPSKPFQAIVTERKLSTDNKATSSKVADHQKRQEDQEKDVANQWIKIEDTLLKYFQHSIHANLLPTFEGLFQNNNVSIRCQSTIQRILLDASKLQKYAIQILDSSGKFPPPGVLEGTLTDLGRFDECLNVNQLLEGDEFPVSTRIRGQYCSLILRPPLPPRPRFHTLCNKVPSLSNLSTSDSLIRWLGQNAHYFYYSPFRIGICSPSQCSPRDIQSLVTKLASSFNFSASILNSECEVDSSKNYSINLVQLFVILSFILFFVIIFTATIVDVYGVGTQEQEKSFLPIEIGQCVYNDDVGKKEVAKGLPPQDVYWFKGRSSVDKEGQIQSEIQSRFSSSSIGSPSIDRIPSEFTHEWIRILVCFSAVRNGSSILKLDDEPTTRSAPIAASSSAAPSLVSAAAPSLSSNGSTTTPPSSLGVIHGLRVVTMAWIILGHTYGLVNPQIHSQVFSASDLYTDPMFQPLLNATLSVDTFFFISGLLTVYVSWSRIVRTKSLPFLTFVSMRYMRLTPSYAAIIAFSLVFPLLSSGPIWRESVQPVASTCYQSWWTNLLYINNFFQTDKLCLMHSWYLANDMQFHVFALIFLAILLKSKIIAFMYLAIAIITCTGYSAIQTYVNDYPPTIISTSPAVEDRWRYILDYYYKPWPHLPSYSIGLILGYILSARIRIPLSRSQERICCIFISFFALLVLYGVYPWNLGWKIPPEITAFYSATFRTVWTLCCAWATYSFLVLNPDGFISSCLSWKGLVPISRLTYMAYLVHPFIIWYSTGSLRERFTASHFSYFHDFLGHYLLTYIISFFVGICFESPFMALQKLIMSPKSRTKIGQEEKVPRPRSTSSSSAVSSSVDELSSSEEKSIGEKSIGEKSIGEEPVTLKTYHMVKKSLERRSNSFLYQVRIDPEINPEINPRVIQENNPKINPCKHTTSVLVG